LLFLLIPLAFLSGFWVARHGKNKSGKFQLLSLHSDYFKGLNFVINEEPDKAIEIFTKMILIDSETVEVHLALGNLFRRRGEVDRAIRIHQNLIARPTLSNEHREQALLELGKDYLRLGILDRAEGLFQELVDSEIMVVPSYRYLLDIYQQEKDWEKAIDAAKRLQKITNDKYELLISQFHCELAELSLTNNDEKMAKSHLKHALNFDPRCVRASFMEGEIFMKSGDYKSAINSFKRIEKQDPDYINEILIPLQVCYREIGHEDKYKEYLMGLLESHDGVKTLVMLTNEIGQQEGNNSAIKFISKRLNKNPTVEGVDQLISYIVQKSDGELKQYLTTVKELTSSLLNSRHGYKCIRCGYEAKHIHWYCPSCKNWDTVKPVQGI
jgi:lipopolysaccharide biosynthesis regulator YciM